VALLFSEKNCRKRPGKHSKAILVGIINATAAAFFGYFPYLCRQFIDEKFGCQLKKSEMSAITKEKKASIFATFGGSEKNTGSIEGQIALLTERINHIAIHQKENKKDFSTNRGLMKLVGERKSLLSYLSKTDLQGYRALIEKLGLRK
jgi:small subunit ribosomal protein S15